MLLPAKELSFQNDVNKHRTQVYKHLFFSIIETFDFNYLLNIYEILNTSLIEPYLCSHTEIIYSQMELQRQLVFLTDQFILTLY